MVDSLEREIQGLRALLHTDRDPQGRAFVPLADAYRRARNLERALAVVSIGLERHPDLASAHVVQAWVQQDRGDPNGAAAAWERVLELDPENVEALRGLGKLLAAAGRTSRAGPLLERARALDPTEREIAEVAAQPDVPVPSSPAAVVLETPAGGSAIATTPSPSVSEPAAAVVAEPDADLDEEELEDSPHELPNTRTLAELYAKQGLHGRAAEVYERLSQERPDDPSLRRRLAELRAQGSTVSAPAAPAGVHDEDTETIARELGVAAAAVEHSVTPFAWAPDEPARDASAEGGQTIAAYFRKLLHWSPADRSGPSMPSRAALPGSGTPKEGVAPLRASVQIPIRHVIPIDSLAPVIVPIELLAPGEVVPVHSLAPVTVPIEMLAPHEGHAFPTTS